MRDFAQAMLFAGACLGMSVTLLAMLGLVLVGAVLMQGGF